MQFLFQFFDLPTQRGLNDVQPLRGSGEIQFLGKRYKVAQLAQFHDCSR